MLDSCLVIIQLQIWPFSNYQFRHFPRIMPFIWTSVHLFFHHLSSISSLSIPPLPVRHSLSQRTICLQWRSVLPWKSSWFWINLHLTFARTPWVELERYMILSIQECLQQTLITHHRPCSCRLLRAKFPTSWPQGCAFTSSSIKKGTRY